MGDAANEPSPGLIGARVRRVEDPRFVSGLGRYLDDLAPAGTLHLRLVRSQLARARLTSVRIGEWDEPPAGTEFVSGADTGDLGIRADTRHESWQPSCQPVLAQSEVRYVGEPVAAVLHPDPYRVEDAAETVVVDYEELEPVIDLAHALTPDAPRVHDGWRDNLFVRRRRRFGDLDGARRAADRVVRRVFRTNRQAGVPLEGRGCLAVPDPAGTGLTLWSSTQMPHVVRTYVARELGLPEHSVRVVAPDVGGGFGVKGHVFGDEVLVAWLALRFGRPVKWVEDRVEHLLGSIHARDHLHLVEAYTTGTGRILGIRAQLVVDSGAYSVFPWTAGSDSGMAAKVLLGPYDIENFEVEDIGVATNKCPLGTYRGVGRPSAVFAMERLIDEVAHCLGLDPVAVRRANLVRDFPYRTANGLLYDSGSYEESLDTAAERVDYDGVRVRQRSAPPSRKRLGIGFALYNEQTAHGTPDFEVRGTPIETGYESVALRVEPDGGVVVRTGMQSHGQGMETTLAQVVAQELGVPLTSVRVVHGDTDSPYCVGTWGSRGATLGGGATARAAREVRAKLLDIAAHQLEADRRDLVLRDGVVQVRGMPASAVGIGELAYIANRHASRLPAGTAPGLEATVFVDGPDRGTFSNSCHAAVVEVDTHTGKVALVRYVVVEDCGTMINPTIVDGQVHGGVAQGIGSALLEEFCYSADGQPTTSTFMDYLLPTSTVVPPIEVHHIVTPSPWTENGAKGMGEAGAIGPMAAIGNAVSDALDRPVLETPLRPERVWWLARAGVDVEEPWQRWSAHPMLAPYWSGTERTEETTR